MDAEIAGQSAKLPAFYYDAAEMTALFPARYGELRGLLPGRWFPLPRAGDRRRGHRSLCHVVAIRSSREVSPAARARPAA